MFKKTPKPPTQLETAIYELIIDLKQEPKGTPKYTEMTKNVEVLMKAKSHEKDRSINPDTALAVAGNLAGIVAILSFEKLNVITSKAIGFVSKVKL